MGEDLEFLLALLLSGASIGLMYSLIALGFVLVYKATDAINFAQGEFVMLAGLIVVTVVGSSAPLLVAVVVVLLAMIAFGFGLEKIVLRPLLGRPGAPVIMATIGVAALIRGLGPIIFGIETRALVLPIGDEPIVLGPASLPPIQVLGAVVGGGGGGSRSCSVRPACRRSRCWAPWWRSRSTWRSTGSSRRAAWASR